MKLLIISGAPLIPFFKGWKAYEPYVNEIKIWYQYADEVQFCCPIWETDKGLLVSEIPFDTQSPIPLREFDIKSVKQVVKSFYATLLNFRIIIKAMRKADHIHLRCPGNIGLLGCIAQIFFPNKPKTAKYAGNWDARAKQPISYRLQKGILSNTFLTRNIRVLVYGEWENSTKNIKPFFTASYFEKEKEKVEVRDLTGKIYFLFVGTLSQGKQPLYAIQLVEELNKKGYDVVLTLYGEGTERENIENYIANNHLENIVFLKGNQNRETVKKAYLENHFIVLPSRSEGWPKVLAEGMFWGCLPVASKVSCVPNMLDSGNRGLLLEMNLQSDVEQIASLLKNADEYQRKIEKAIQWSRQYTMDVFEEEIKKILKL